MEEHLDGLGRREPLGDEDERVALAAPAGDALDGDALDAGALGGADRRVGGAFPDAAAPGRLRWWLSGGSAERLEVRHGRSVELLQRREQVLVLALAAGVDPTQDLLVLGPGGIGRVLDVVGAEHLVHARARAAELRLVVAEPLLQQRDERAVVEAGVALRAGEAAEAEAGLPEPVGLLVRDRLRLRGGVLERQMSCRCASSSSRRDLRNFHTMPGPDLCIASNRNSRGRRQASGRCSSGSRARRRRRCAPTGRSRPERGSSYPARGSRARARAPPRRTCRDRTWPGRRRSR